MSPREQTTPSKRNPNGFPARLRGYSCITLILLLGWACTTTIAGVLIAGHDRFPTYYAAEFTGQLMDLWAYHHGVRIDFSRRGKPTDNAFIETFNGTLRDECLNLHWMEWQAGYLCGALR